MSTIEAISGVFCTIPQVDVEGVKIYFHHSHHILHSGFMNIFEDLLCLFCLVFPMPLCTSVYMCFVVTCWERADLLALVCGVQL